MPTNIQKHPGTQKIKTTCVVSSLELLFHLYHYPNFALWRNQKKIMKHKILIKTTVLSKVNGGGCFPSTLEKIAFFSLPYSFALYNPTACKKIIYESCTYEFIKYTGILN